MRTVQMTLDADLVASVDRAARQLRTSRSEFTRRALREAMERLRTLELEKKHREGYKRKPVKGTESSAWEKEQVWPET